ncbi:hypothetical protein CKM354_000053700 [Cercospora kikuchii]|uniref:Sld7 C-terminal domain-containing protein n=1 Tax=Cercospora kikuchii TaxID=84275 RepID=A0A9P3C420_9PEZI|nr:uncharacterized protein CKM354_000053700 [Cercospora kikuchii]GIZ37074.1 hypothetical protein CKM354_000053700 [Cercospora kikuchii]
MLSAWHGDIAINDAQKLEDITLSVPDGQQTHISADSTLHLVSIVETARIPLFISIGKSYHVTSSNSASEAWFSGTLLASTHGEDNPTAWWQTARSDSPLGVLVGISSPRHVQNSQHVPKATEFLFYAAREPTTDTFGVYAQPLCSNLLGHHALAEPTPPSSPINGDSSFEARFLPMGIEEPRDEVINVPPIRKRKTAIDTFDEAAERRKQVRRKGGEAIAAAASRTVSNEPIPSLKHRRTVSNTQITTRPTSRASSVSSLRAAPARENSVPAHAKRSALAKVESAEGAAVMPKQDSLESKNKELITKVVMAGMRLYGLVQSKNRKSRANSFANSPAREAKSEDLELDRKNDEEYKLVYHQIHKGTCFAFRQHINNKSLANHSEALRETVDKFLVIHCTDPLILDSMNGVDECTPSGRKPFGSAIAAPTSTSNPFLTAHAAGGESKTNTPCDRKASLKTEPT